MKHFGLIVCAIACLFGGIFAGAQDSESLDMQNLVKRVRAAQKTSKTAAIPDGCVQCLSQCPHMSREMRECDRGCPDSCSSAQVAQYAANKPQDKDKGASCYQCMSECPHLTRDLKECDRGCPQSCDSTSLRSALLKANVEIRKCGNPPSSNLYENRGESDSSR